MQSLIRSRVFQLQYSRDGPRDVYQLRSRLPYITLTYNESEGADVESDGLVYRDLVGARRGQEALVVTNPTWPTSPLGAAKDAYDVVMELCLGWHSGSLVRFRNATVPECWDGRLDKVLNRCVPLQRGSK